MTPRARSNAGFTLIEALAALAALAAILAGLAVIAGQWMPQWRHGFEALQNSDLTAQSLDRVVADLAAALPARLDGGDRSALFQGDANAVTFVRDAIGPDSTPKLEYVRIGATDTKQGVETQRARASFLPGAIAPFRDAATLLRPPFRLRFAYQALDGRWTASWPQNKALPRAIRLTVVKAGAQVATTAFLLNTPTGLDASAPTPSATDAQPSPDLGQK